MALSAHQKEAPNSGSQKKDQPTQAAARPPERSEATLETRDMPMDTGGQVTPPPEGEEGNQRSGPAVQGNTTALHPKGAMCGRPSHFLSRIIKAGVKPSYSFTSMLESKD